LLKNGHLLRFPHPSSLRRTPKYASLLRISGALHLALFEQPEREVERTSGSFLNFFCLEELFQYLIGLEAHDPFSIDHKGWDGRDSEIIAS
jgi:hypothetical protein